MLFFVLYSPLLFISLFLFSDYLFFTKINKRRAGLGPDRTDVIDNRNAGQDGGRGGNRYVSCYFLLSTLFISSSRSSSVLIVYSKTSGRAGQGGTG